MTIAMPDWAVVLDGAPRFGLLLLRAFLTTSCAFLSPGVSEAPLVNVSIWDILKATDEPQVPAPAPPCSPMCVLS